MMSAILNAFKSPAPGSVNGDKELRGMKRKAKGDPYEEIDDGKEYPMLYYLCFYFQLFNTNTSIDTDM